MSYILGEANCERCFGRGRYRAPVWPGWREYGVGPDYPCHECRSRRVSKREYEEFDARQLQRIEEERAAKVAELGEAGAREFYKNVRKEFARQYRAERKEELEQA